MSYVSKENLDNIIRGLSNKISMSVSNGALIGDTTPVGTVISFMGTQAPLYYLICDGTTYNIAEYQELADFIEVQFGAVNYFGGDGVTTFAVPDLRGEFLRGSGTNSHENQGSGANVGVHQDATEHVFLSTDTPNATLYLPYTGGEATIDKLDSQFQSYSSSTYCMVTGRKQNGWDMDDKYTSRPTNTSVLYCIKYTKAVIPSEYEDGTPVGRVIFDSILREGYIKANGAQIEDASISIPRLLSFVQKYSSQLIANNQETYDANVGLYMYDSNNDILTLPNYVGRFLEGGNSVTSIEAGLPNIKGETSQQYSSNQFAGWHNNTGKDRGTGALYIKGSGTNYGQQSPWHSYASHAMAFDASRSNSIYSDSVTTVQPSSITLIPQIRY